MNVKGKRRVVERRYFNNNTLYLLQIYERTVFKRWLNVGVTSDKGYARQWEQQAFLTEREQRKQQQERKQQMKIQRQNKGEGEGLIVLVLGILGVLVILGGCWAWPNYNVYSQRLAGAAALAHAQSSKEVAVAEAKAKMESASLLAQAEVARANGVAQANKIIGDSLKGNEVYLRYLWITDVAGANVDKTVVYIPTEVQLPIMEAGRTMQQQQHP